jgi:hypothetical protein
MINPHPFPIGHTRVFSKIFQSDRLAIVNDSGSIHGTSLVAKTPFEQGELILPLIGTIAARSVRTIQIDVRRHLDGALMAFMNHSCRPTSIVLTRALCVRAVSDLKAGDEITFFYPSTEWDMVHPFKCLCPAHNCIGFVAGAQYLSIATLSSYFLNAHIQELATEAFFAVASA